MADKIKIACQKGNSGPYQKEVEGRVFGAWAAHKSVNDLDYSATFVRLGLAVPYEFWTELGARKAAKAINELRPNWDDATVADIKALGSDILEICARQTGERTSGSKGEPVPVSDLPVAAE